MERYLIAGLGNPGTKYENTRHNAGFQSLDKLAEKLCVQVKEEKFRGLIGEAFHDGKKLILLKPQTYMNLSGESVAEAAAYYDMPPENILVIYDDINLAPGKLRVRLSGSAGGHNGMKSIVASLGSSQFPRVRVGVGMNEVIDSEGNAHRIDLAQHVLAKLTGETRAAIEEAEEKAAEAALCILDEGMETAMNRYNG